VVFGTVLLDPANPDFTILGRPLVDVLVLGSLVVLHGVALVMLVKPSGRLVSRARSRWAPDDPGSVGLVDAVTTIV
jgi:hypothetical protein